MEIAINSNFGAKFLERKKKNKVSYLTFHLREVISFRKNSP